MTIPVFADAEGLAIDVLRAAPEIDPDTTVSWELRDLPALVVTAAGGTTQLRQKIDAPRLQIDAWAPSREEARELIAFARSILTDTPLRNDEAVATSCVCTQAPLYMPDSTDGRQCYSAEFQLIVVPIT